jgi:hypothetical protein
MMAKQTNFLNILLNPKNTKTNSGFFIMRDKRDFGYIVGVEYGPYLDSNGTHFTNDTYTATIDELSLNFGPPLEGGNIDDKVQYSWTIQIHNWSLIPALGYSPNREELAQRKFKGLQGAILSNTQKRGKVITGKELLSNHMQTLPDSVESSIVTIYDWKQYRPIERDEKIEWHLGSQGRTHQSNVELANDALSRFKPCLGAREIKTSYDAGFNVKRNLSGGYTIE